jgi:hypothetical protein
VSRDIFSKKLATFWYFCLFKTHSFLKNLNVTSHTGGGGGGGTGQCHQMTQGGRGSKIGQKSVTYYLNGPLFNRNLVIVVQFLQSLK